MDALDQPEQHRGGYQVRAPIGNEWQRKAAHWGDPQRHANILEDLLKGPIFLRLLTLLNLLVVVLTR